MTADEMATLLDNVSGPNAKGWRSARCPAHDDRRASLGFRQGKHKARIKCHAGCTREQVMRAAEARAAAGATQHHLTLAAFAADKQLPEQFLRESGVEQEGSGLRITYRLEDGTLAPRQRRRTALAAREGSTWFPGEASPVPYGLWKLAEARQAGWLLLPEGETDTLTAWYHNVPCLGLPGAATASYLTREHLRDLAKIYVSREPDTGGDAFIRGIANRFNELDWRGDALILAMPIGIKDLNDLHRANPDDFPSRLRGAMEAATALPRTPTGVVLAPSTLNFTSAGDPVHHYEARPTGLVWFKETRDGEVEKRLTNFVAAITADIAEDDGAETRRLFEIETTLNNRTTRFVLPAAKFAAMGWPTEQLGASAVIYPGMSTRDHARVAIQILSGDVPEQKIYAHIGWAKVGEHWLYLHAGGAIGADGPVDSLVVRVPRSVSRYALSLPPSPKALIGSIKASLAFVEVAPDHVTFPLYAAMARSVVGRIDCGLFLAGPTGAGKSEVAALIQQHFGAEMTRVNLPAAWSSTGNALEDLAFQAKDAIFVIDDYVPRGPGDFRLQREADRVLRAQGNISGRLRMRADGTLRPARFPRGLILATGEDIPPGHSLRARFLTIEVEPQAVRWDRMTACQADAADGRYASALGGFVRWLAPRVPELPDMLRAELARHRQALVDFKGHRRTPDAMAHLLTGLRLWLDYAVAVCAITKVEAADLSDRARSALSTIAAQQPAHQEANDPASRFIELLTAALASGRAHLAGPNGDRPTGKDGWGWRRNTSSDTFGDSSWRASGDRVGWIDEGEIYLEPEAAYAVVSRLAHESGEGLPVSSRTLHKRLHQRGFLASTDSTRSKLTIRRSLDGRRRNVLHLRSQALSGEPAQPAQAPAPVEARA